MAKLDPAVLAHLEWIGFVRPTGLVVSAPALTRAGAILDRSDVQGQRLLASCVEERVFNPDEGPAPFIPDFGSFARQVLGWSFSPKGYAGMNGVTIPTELEVPLPDYGETLRPDLAVRERDPADGAPEWQLLVRVLDPGEDFDQVNVQHGALEASPHSRMERLLRETRVPSGLLFNGRSIRLVSAPRGESSGWIDFKVADMLQTAGRPISSAVRLLLSEQRLLALPSDNRLAALLRDSRKFQNEVSERLAEQVLHALYELLRGFQSAHDRTNGELLRLPLSDAPDLVYRALLTVILRLVFVLYAEERDMLPGDEAFLSSYSVAGLYDRLREDAALHPDTMDHRYGAWAQLLVLFRMMHDGAIRGDMRLPARHGGLFDPNRYPFLEGWRGNVQQHQRTEPPLVPDGTIHRVLEDLLVLDGERISYRALDVEQIGSVYETMMGFRLEAATGQSIAIRPQKKHGAPVTLDLDQTLTRPSAKRGKWVTDQTGRKLTPKVGTAVAKASSLDDLHAALAPVVDYAATPDLVPQGAMVLQPSEERRRSGSHYTPRALTEPIVRKTLEPILERLREQAGGVPKAEHILELKVCDPAMGSGAFLVETCRQLADALIEAWRAYDVMPDLPPDEDEVIYARRLIAQRCLYGVDRNPVAVDLAKMSLWLATLARDHAFTFLDHAFRHGDSLVGLTKRQIRAFHWKDDAPVFAAGFEAMRMEEHLKNINALRARIRESGEEITDFERHDLWDQVESELSRVRLFGDLVMAAFFEGTSAKERESKRATYARAIQDGTGEQYRVWLDEWRHEEIPLAPFHWEIEFPEVFERERPGFDAIVGNPPFLGGARIWSLQGSQYPAWLKHVHPNSGGKAVDMVVHFFRRANVLTRPNGFFGMLATKTIAEGDSRSAGLRQICISGSQIYRARRRFPWPGSAAVVVSVIHIARGPAPMPILLDGQPVEGINSFLFPRTDEFEAKPLLENAGRSFRGADIYGSGFIFADEDNSELAGNLERMRALIERDEKNSQVIFPYIGGKELTTHPTHQHHRYVISFGDMSLEEARQWPDLIDIVEAKVKPVRDALSGYSVAERRRDYWWQFGNDTPALYRAVADIDAVLAISQTTTHICFAYLPSRMIFSQKLIIFPVHFGNREFAVLQSRVHEAWALLLGSTQGVAPVYSPTDCFETFPFPDGWETDGPLEATGEQYYKCRAELMVRRDEGLTKAYNRFHDPYEDGPDIARLREQHAGMDRAVLEAYGWTDIPTQCDFYLDYEIDEEELGNKKKPWRYRWPDEVRDEVLARLLALNKERAAEEKRSGTPGSKRKTKPMPVPDKQEEKLFDDDR